MKTRFTLAFCCCSLLASAQVNFLDRYLTDSLTYTVILSSSDGIDQPRDLDFKPNTRELWVCNYGDANGGSIVMAYNAGRPDQQSQYRKDTRTGHFMRYPSAIAFGNNRMWACVSEIQNTSSPTSTFMGPTLWSSDTAIFARVFQNNWLNGYPLGSHYDMLHQSPFAMGIAHDSALVYWVMDGHFGTIVRYDYVQDHGPGYDDHSAGKIWRYTDVNVTRVPGIPSHMELDKANGWLYFIDGGSQTIRRMNINSGSVTSTLSVPGTSNELLSGYWAVTGATVEIIDTLDTRPCGLDYFNDRLVVTDYDSGYIYMYNTAATPTLMGTIQTGHLQNMGVKIGYDGKIWFVNYAEDNVYRIDPSMPVLDASIESLDIPSGSNFNASFFATGFNMCLDSVSPVVTLTNHGTDPIISATLNWSVDSGAAFVDSWSGTLAPGGSVQHTLPATAVPIGRHQLDVWISDVNGNVDDVTQNNKATSSFRIVAPQVLPYSQGFASATFPPAGWDYVHYNLHNRMTRVTVGGFGASVGSLRMDNYTGYENVTGQEDHLISPSFDFSAVIDPYLSFSVAYAQYSSSQEQLTAAISVDCGDTWIDIYSKQGSALATTPAIGFAFTPNATQWRSDSVNLLAYAGQSAVMLRFSTTSDHGNNVFIDDIYIGDAPVGLPPIARAPSANLFPNPAISEVQLVFDRSYGKVTVQIVNMLGETMSRHETIATDRLSLPLGTYAPGIYLARIETPDGILNLPFTKE